MFLCCDSSIYTIGSTVLLAALAVGGVLYYYGHDLPDRLDLASTYEPAVVSTVYDMQEKPIGEFYLQRRFVVRSIGSRSMSSKLCSRRKTRDSTRTAGVDIYAIVRASFANLKRRGVHEGASTLTQQLVRGFFLTPERTFSRKIREAILAYRVEKNHTKDEILYLYLNQVYFGHGNYGIEAACRDYFGKSVGEINIAEAALLAGLPRSPSRNSPYRDFFAARERQRYVLGRMLAEGYITRALTKRRCRRRCG
jgi:penicillin-binding protein 1A